MSHNHLSTNLDAIEITPRIETPTIPQRVQRALGERATILQETIATLEQQLVEAKAEQAIVVDQLSQFSEDDTFTTTLVVDRQRFIDEGYTGYYEKISSQNFDTHDTDVHRIIDRLVAAIANPINQGNQSICWLPSRAISAITVETQDWSHELDFRDNLDIIRLFNTAYEKAERARRMP